MVCPFESISILDRMIEQNTLIHPEDFDKFKEFGKFLNQKGRDLSVWVVPESSILHKTSLITIPSGGNVSIAETLHDAISKVENHRKERNSILSTT
jgi:hypothetical protein